MGCQGIVTKKSVVDRVARHFNRPWKAITVYCWRDNDFYWVIFGTRMDPWFPHGARIRVHRSNLSPAPLYPVTRFAGPHNKHTTL